MKAKPKNFFIILRIKFKWHFRKFCKSLGIKDPVKKFMDEDYPLTEIFAHVWRAIHNKIRGIKDDETEKKKFHYKVLRTLMAVIDVCYLFVKENLMRKSADLTYSTLMSVVPVLAIIFAMAKGFGQDHIMWIQLEKIIGSEHQLTQSIMSSVSKSIELTTIKNGYIFGVALIVLIWTANSAMYKLETIFNEIWHVENSKGWFGKLPSNCFFLMLVPSILMIVSGLFGYSEQIGDSSFFVESAYWFVRIILSSIVFFLMYKFLPDTKVGWGNALVMGIVFGCVFTIWHMVYVYFQDMLFNYNKVYGSFAAIPFFLIWALLAWSICLVGAQFCYVIQNDLFYDIDATQGYNNDFSLQEKHQTMAKVLSIVCYNLKKHRHGCSFDEIKKEIKNVDDMKVICAIDSLKKHKLIHYSNDKFKQQIYPSFDTSSFTLFDLMKRLFENNGIEEVNVHNKNNQHEECITFASISADSIPTIYNKTLLDYYEEVLNPALKEKGSIL